MRSLTIALAWLILSLAGAGRADAQLADWVATAPSAGAFVLADRAGAARVITSAADHPAVDIAARDLRRDLERVSGKAAGTSGAQIWAGTLGRNPRIDRLIAAGRLDARALKGAWESFVIATVERPQPGIERALVIAGSDRRGTAYGIYELSRAIGVSPWHWWADVAPLRQSALYVAGGTRRFGPPSVKYRGIFINDEDWGLAPWAATNFEPQNGGIGPRTYEKVFELLLRLKANTLWPAMHKISPAFNADRRNAQLADRYGIVMGSSHAEPMLRNNVREWTGPAATYDYSANPAGVRIYWDERLRTNGAFENIYTLGMRGIHDSAMVGVGDMSERRALLERIIGDQRQLLRRRVSADVGRVPQVFAGYKEVLDIYRSGLKVPDDVTLMWPDDNFGYVRRFPSTAERNRRGGAGVYYHLSYLGAPLAYLWLSTTPPALVEEEMGRAYDLGARRMWIANVGDIKPAELATDYFLSLAWDVPGTRALGVDGFVRRWAGENVDAGRAADLARLVADHHRLNFERRPEHLQWWLPGEKPQPSPYSIAQADARIAEFDRNLALLRDIGAAIAPERRDAFFELVQYPVEAAAEANRRYFAAEAHDRLRDSDLPRALSRAAEARAADARIAELTRQYNDLAGGKWRGIMAVEPADGQWKTFRALPPVLPPALDGRAATGAGPGKPENAGEIVVRPSAFRGSWRLVEQLGRQGSALASRSDRPVSGTATVALAPGRWRVLVDLLPTYPDRDGEPLRLTLRSGDREVQLSAPREVGDRAWSQAVLDNRITLATGLVLSGGGAVELSAAQGGIVVEGLRFVAEDR